MQTFLPYADFAAARCLDRLRLGKQRVETYQLLRALLVPGSGWANHPATKMWRGYETSLCRYGLAVCLEWTGRGYKDTCADKIDRLGESVTTVKGLAPPWLGDPAFHAAHRSNLLRKDPAFYGQ